MINIQIDDAVAIPTKGGFIFGVVTSITTHADAKGEKKTYEADIYNEREDTHPCGIRGPLYTEVIPIEREPGNTWTVFGRRLNTHAALRWALNESARRINPPKPEMQPEGEAPAPTENEKPAEPQMLQPPDAP
jgi:hypothetical protein